MNCLNKPLLVPVHVCVVWSVCQLGYGRAFRLSQA